MDSGSVGERAVVSGYIDISVPLGPGVVVWPGHAPPTFSHFHGELDGAAYTVTRMELGSHTGTHVDAPFHFNAGGCTVDALPWEALIGPAQVCDLQGIYAISEEHLRAQTVGAPPRCLLKTDNSQWIRTGPISQAPAYLTPEAASYLVAQGVRLVGLDGLSIDHPERAASHLVLLTAGVVILETIDLAAVDPGLYELACLPLLLAGGDGAPARAVLRRHVPVGRES